VRVSDDTPGLVLDTAAYERARLARDPRFDGRFYIGVLSTGVYCRPICPVQPPLAKNVRFFASAAAAAEAGFRPCLRCRPESSPGTPLSRGTAATVHRALRLIDEGALDGGAGVDSLAARLGVGARQLGRLCTQHLGASPVQLAQTRRLHLALKLLRESRLPISAVAEAAGYGSVRRFNEAIDAAYRRPPRSLRRGRKLATRAPAPETAPGVRLELAYRPPLDWRTVCAFHAFRALPGVEVQQGERYLRSFALNGQHGVLAVEPVPGRHKLALSVHCAELSALPSIVARVRRMFDLDADPLSIERDLRSDRVLAPRLRAAPGLRVPGAWDGFELAVRAVLGQAISVTAARTLATRLVQRHGLPLAATRSSPGASADADTTLGAGPSLIFPDAERLSSARLDGLGITSARVATIRALAREVSAGRLALDGSLELDALLEALQALPGVGPWTAHYVALRSGGYPDAFPSGDLGLQCGAASCLDRAGERLSARELEAHAERWRPWRAYAAMHLWSAYPLK
jgi:AraC family transcriptional regulator of adaptative response / DNA-3-methyladenine glycosylase II